MSISSQKRKITAFLLDSLRKKEVIAGIVLFCIVIGVYAATVGQFHTSFADSDELSMMGYLLGIPHQPGYPIYTLMLFFMTHLFPFGSPAFKANFLSSILQACTVVITYMILIEVLANRKLKPVQERVKKKAYKTVYYLTSIQEHEGARVAIAFLASLLLAFSFLFWLYANTAEVFALNDLFAVVLLYLLLRLARYCYETSYQSIAVLERGEGEYIEQKKQNPQKVLTGLLIIALVAGLGLSHHQTIILLFPAYFAYLLYVLIRTKYIRSLLQVKTLMLLLLTFFLAFFVPFLILIPINNLHTSVSWSLGSGLGGLFQDIFRTQYAQVSASGNAYVTQVQLNWSLESIWPYLQIMGSNFTLIPLLLAVLGAFFLLLRNRKLFLLIVGSYLVSGLLFIMYAMFPQLQNSSDIVLYFGNIATLERQFILGSLFLPILMAVGLYALFLLLKRAFIALPEKNMLFAVLGIIIFGAFLVAYEFTQNFQSADLRTYSYMDDYSKTLLTSLDKHAILVCFSDISCFSDLYEQQVEDVRKDILIVPASYGMRQQYLDAYPDLVKFQYPSDQEKVAQIIVWNVYKGRSVYVTDVPNAAISYLGLNGDAYFLQPVGLADKIVTRVPTSYTEDSYKPERKFIAFYDGYTNNGYNAKNYWEKTIKGIYTGDIVINYFVARLEDFYGNHKANFTIGYNLNDGFQYYAQEIQQINAYNQTMPFYPGEQRLSAEKFFTYAQGSTSNPNRALTYALYASFIDPLNPQIHSFLASTYLSVGDKVNALAEYRNVATLQPSNRQAVQEINSLSQ